MRKMNCLAVAALACAAPLAQADVVMNMSEVGGDIVIETTGSIDLRSTASFTSTFDRGDVAFNARNDGGIFVGTFAMNTDRYALAGNLTASGDWVSQAFVGGLGGPDEGVFLNSIGDGSLFITEGYVSNDAINTTHTIPATTFADLGFSNGDVGVVTWSNNGVEESLTMNWNVPAPGAIALLGLAGFACGRRRRA